MSTPRQLVFRKPPQAGAEDQLGWALTSRFAFIEERVFWTDSVNRADVVEKFMISKQQASGDFTRYQELAPDNLVYDKSDKTYRAGPAFRPLFIKPDSAEALGQFRLVAEGVLPADTLASAVPLALAPAPSRPVDITTLRHVVLAINQARQLRTFYVSFTGSAPRERIIEPHALAFDGFRWHARARDLETGSFRDYVLGRLSGTALQGPATSQGADDADWQAMTTLVIAPNPGLETAQQAVIAQDYGMVDGRAEVQVRRALAYYTKLRLGLDLKRSARVPKDQHIVLIEERG